MHRVYLLWEKYRDTVFLIAWLLSILAIRAIASNVLVYLPSFPYWQGLAQGGYPHWFSSGANFDGVHYLTISTQGYSSTNFIQAFFPLYPTVTGFLSRLFMISPIAIGQIVSWVCLGVGMYVWKNLLEEKGYHARTALGLLLIFPTAFFFAAFYTEALSFLLLGLALRASHHKQWLRAGLWVALLSATRVVGIGAVLAVAWEWSTLHKLVPARMPSWTHMKNVGSTAAKQWWSKQRNAVFAVNAVQQLKTYFFRVWKAIKQDWKSVLSISVGSLGLVSYMAYLQYLKGDPLYFFHVQSEFGGGRQESLVLFPQVVWRYMKILVTYPVGDYKFLPIVWEFIAGLGGFLLLLISLPLVPFGWWLFGMVAFMVPTLTGTFSSMPRYVLLVVPLWVGASVYFEKAPFWIKAAWITVSTLTLIWFTILFTQGYWVA